MTITPEQRAEWRALADSATDGPWEADHSEEDNSSVKVAGSEWWDGLAFAGRQGDAEFIAASRQAVPALLDALDQAERERDEWEQAAMKLAESSNAANADLHDLRASMAELAPAEVCVRGDWFKVSELPEVLGRVMDSRDEAQREAKRYYLRAMTPATRRDEETDR